MAWRHYYNNATTQAWPCHAASASAPVNRASIGLLLYCLYLGTTADMPIRENIRMIELIQSKRDQLKELCEHYHVRRLALFGSAVSGAFDSRTSDLDFVVDFEHTDSMNMADQYFGLLEGLQKLFQRRIDLVTEHSIRNPYFKNAVDQTRILLYAA